MVCCRFRSLSRLKREPGCNAIQPGTVWTAVVQPCTRRFQCQRNILHRALHTRKISANDEQRTHTSKMTSSATIKSREPHRLSGKDERRGPCGMNGADNDTSQYGVQMTVRVSVCVCSLSDSTFTCAPVSGGWEWRNSNLKTHLDVVDHQLS